MQELIEEGKRKKKLIGSKAIKLKLLFRGNRNGVKKPKNVNMDDRARNNKFNDGRNHLDFLAL